MGNSSEEEKAQKSSSGSIWADGTRTPPRSSETPGTPKSEFFSFANESLSPLALQSPSPSVMFGGIVDHTVKSPPGSNRLRSPNQSDWSSLLAPFPQIPDIPTFSLATEGSVEVAEATSLPSSSRSSRRRRRAEVLQTVAAGGDSQGEDGDEFRGSVPPSLRSPSPSRLPTADSLILMVDSSPSKRLALDTSAGTLDRVRREHRGNAMCRGRSAEPRARTDSIGSMDSDGDVHRGHISGGSAGEQLDVEGLRSPGMDAVAAVAEEMDPGDHSAERHIFGGPVFDKLPRLGRVDSLSLTASSAMGTSSNLGSRSSRARRRDYSALVPDSTRSMEGTSSHNQGYNDVGSGYFSSPSSSSLSSTSTTPLSSSNTRKANRSKKGSKKDGEVLTQKHKAKELKEKQKLAKRNAREQQRKEREAHKARMKEEILNKLQTPFGSPAGTGTSDHLMISPVHGDDKRVRCNCKKSKCLKLYCDCFRMQIMCSGCNCQECNNNAAHDEQRRVAMAAILERNAAAFKPRVGVDVDKNGSLAEAAHMNGCHCKRSACLKKYCECFTGQVARQP